MKHPITFFFSFFNLVSYNINDPCYGLKIMYQSNYGLSTEPQLGKILHLEQLDTAVKVKVPHQE